MSQPASQPVSEGEVIFRRIVTPLPTGRVRVKIEARQGGKLIGRITQAGPLWRFTPATDQWPRWRGKGMLWRTAEEARRGVSASAGEAASEEVAAASQQTTQSAARPT